MSLKVDKVHLEIIMKSDSTRAEIIKLEDQAKSLQKQMRGLKKDTEEYTRLSSEYGKVKTEIDKLRASIDLNGKTMCELTQRARELRSMMKNLTPGNEKWNEYNKELQLTNARMRELRVSGQAAESVFSQLTNKFNKYFYAAIPFIATFTSIIVSIKKLVDGYAELEDSYADVMKVTGLTREETEKLNSEYSKLDTRTSRESLNQLAVQAGKLGIEGTKNILSFVDAGNQINVALGEDLGADAVQNIGKMVGVFDEVTTQLQGKDLKGQLLSVGSAVNSLGQASSASEQYLVDFSGRLGGVASQAKISLADVLGFASQLDQDMQHVEMAATSFQMFITKMMAEPAKFAKIAGINVKEFTNLVSTDANAAIKKILTTLNEKGGFQQLIPIFEGMNLDGSRAIGVLSSMASSIDKINEAQLLANQSMADGTSIINEYNVKNNNTAAQLEKNKKQLTDLSHELGKELTPAMMGATNILISFLKTLSQHPTIVFRLIAALTAYLVVLNRSVLLEKAQELLHSIRLLGLKLRIALTNQATAAELRLVGAQDALNASMKKNLWGLVAAAIAYALVYLVEYMRRLNSATELETARMNIQKKVNEQYDDQAAKIDVLVARIKNENLSNEQRKQAINDLKAIIPGYNGMIDEEGKLINHNKAAIDAYLISLEKQIKLKATQDEWEELIRKKRTQQREIDKYKEQKDNIAGSLTPEYASKYGGAAAMSAQSAAAQIARDANNATRALNQTNEALKALEKEMKTTDIPILTGDAPVTPTNPTTPGGSSSSTEGKNTDPADIALQAAEESYKAELLALKNSLIEKEITETQFAEKGETLHLQHLNSKLKIQKEYNKSTVDTETEIANWKLNKQKTEDEQLLDAIKISNDAKLSALAELDALQKQQLQDEVDSGTLTNSQYQERLQAIELTSAQARLQIARDYLALVEQGEFNSAEAKQKAVDAAAKAVEQASKEEEKAVKSSNKAKLKSEEQYQKDREALLKQLGILSIREQYALEKKELDKHLADKLITEQEHAEAVRKLKAEKAGAYAQQAVEIANGVADAVTAYHQMEADSLEAEKQRELTAAGDNADAREAIEKKYAQKELDLKKKQANADMGIKIAQAVAGAAQAIVSIWAVHAANPILAAALTVVAGATTLFQIASIKKQRDAIMATTLDSSGSSPSSSTGALVANSQLPVTKQAADGRWDVVGADDRRTYRNVPYRGIARTGIVARPTLMGERGDELIIDNPTLRNIRMNAPGLISEVMRMRVRQRASGKWDTDTASNDGGLSGSIVQLVLDENTKTMQEVASLLRWLRENRIEAYTVLSEFEKKRDLRDKSVRKGSL